jgi:hypothetical protein
MCSSRLPALHDAINYSLIKLEFCTGIRAHTKNTKKYFRPAAHIAYAVYWIRLLNDSTRYLASCARHVPGVGDKNFERPSLPAEEISVHKKKENKTDQGISSTNHGRILI